MNVKVFSLTLAVTASLVCVYPCLALEHEEEATAKIAVVARVAPDAEPCESAIATVTLEADGDGGHKVLFVNADSEGSPCVVVGDAHGAKALKFVSDPNRGWLGVQLAQVSPVLVAHFPSAEGGVLIHNVVKGSPAKEAGLEKFDIITSFNGERIEEGVGGLAKAIGVLEPGSEVSLKVLREGKELTVSATLASRPGHKRLDWLHQFVPEAVEREFIEQRGKIISKDEDGNWHVEDLGDLSEMEDLPDDIREMLPGAHQIITKISVDDDRESINAMVMRDGEAIAIEQEDGGEIVVKRTDKDGNETEETYADAEALKEGDAEAYDIYDQSATGSRVEIHLGDDEDKTFHWYGHGHGLDKLNHVFKGREEWKSHFEEAMKEYREAMEGAQKGLEEARRHMKLHFRGMPRHPFFSDDDEGGSAFSFGVDIGKATRSFRINPDGGIEVVIRKGENEAIKMFRDEADLKQRDPELYEQYAETLSDE